MHPGGFEYPRRRQHGPAALPFFTLSFCLRRWRHECGYAVSRLIGYSFKPTSVFILHLLTAANIKTPFEDYHYSLLLTLARHPYRQLDISTPGGIRNSTMFAGNSSKYCESNHALFLWFLSHSLFLSAPSYGCPFLDVHASAFPNLSDIRRFALSFAFSSTTSPPSGLLPMLHYRTASQKGPTASRR
jgi:hypothetical protein